MIPRSGRAGLASIPPPPGEPQHEGADQARSWSGAHDRSRHGYRCRHDEGADITLRRTCRAAERTRRASEGEHFGDLEGSVRALDTYAGQHGAQRDVADAELIGELVLAGEARDAAHEGTAEWIGRVAHQDLRR